MKLLRIFLLTLGLLAVFSGRGRAQSDRPLALVLKAEGPIMPTMQEYIQRGIRIAERENAEVLIVELNTPGGLITVMNQITETIRASRVPVIVYVGPRGAWAASAGAVITMSAHAAAMAPQTTIGAASPVGGSGEDLGETMKAKEMEALTAKARTFTQWRGEEALQLAESMILKATAVTSDEALKVHLIDFIANDTSDLLQKLDGFTVQMMDGPRTLHTANARTESLPMTFVEEFLLVLNDPNIISILMTIGMLALYFELAQPGGWVSGFIGVVCIALAIYGGGSLSLNWFGIIFLVTAFVLFLLDIKAPTHGGLTAAGAASFIFGMLVLFNSTPAAPFEFQPRVSTPLVVGTGVLLGGMAFAVMTIALRARHAPIRAGVESLSGKTGKVTAWSGQTGQVQLQSELWSAEQAEGSGAIRKGDQVEVVEVKGLRLKVRKH
ncbi:MAG: serine protease [Chloroflexota bacterium]|nr:MAG: serine protease [Chloroflexota bacterium]